MVIPAASSSSRRKKGLIHYLSVKYVFFALNAILLFAFVYFNQGNNINLDIYRNFDLEQNQQLHHQQLDHSASSDSNSNSTSDSIDTSINTSTVTPTSHNDPDLHKTATVMAMATGYSVSDYRRYVGSLRKTGYEGNIILVVAPDIGRSEEEYLTRMNVTMHKVQHTKCTHNAFQNAKESSQKNGHTMELLTCVHPYPKLKHRWARFPLLRDLLKDCGGKPNPSETCGGPVLISDMRDTFFQRNPFGPEAPIVQGLQVFEEHYTIRTTHWLVNWPLGDCKNVHYDEPMLCSGTTIGTRQAMLDYLEIFHGEMMVWMEDTNCHFEINGDDQTIHNYLYYSGMLQNVTGGVHAVKNRDGLVHTVGALGSLIFNTHKREKEQLRDAQARARGQGSNPNFSANGEKFDLSAKEDPSTSKNWLGLHYGLTDKDGYFTQYNGSRSFVIHQYDRFGHQFVNWLQRNSKKILGE
mmetsp:Transcript_8929/g.12706  ORF Transcript_8929/g.12706 Transcript_8929/m.12706 type:complete len:466 (+) Transcript_8929:133-1530(+)|eukprot:CAMPEP_0184869226 /NCGR_PEP_ID=MMETSP0580-20130426/33421_1 /TAXON_ID=1118495 /ORGANISM="Dactyliosolen fragilissimus" /LENGTH=465 /DNA_ID=CAMNT_0027370583 /DNA_START=131 /DNA_END=1528 /DNA_ORIENTATION=-